MYLSTHFLWLSQDSIADDWFGLCHSRADYQTSDRPLNRLTSTLDNGDHAALSRRLKFAMSGSSEICLKGDLFSL